MTKNQWFHRVILAAGTIVLASACHGPIGPCEYNEETGDTFCNSRSIAEPSTTPAPTVVDVAPVDH